MVSFALNQIGTDTGELTIIVSLNFVPSIGSKDINIIARVNGCTNLHTCFHHLIESYSFGPGCRCRHPLYIFLAGKSKQNILNLSPPLSPHQILMFLIFKSTL